MRIDRIYRISAFGDFLNIQPTPENMFFFLESFKDYGLVPSIFQEMKIENSALPPVPLQRIAMVSIDNSRKTNERISIASNRMDFQITTTDDIQLNNEQIKEINETAYNRFNVIFNKYDKKSSRLALNTESLLTDLSDKEVIDFMARYTNPIELYNRHAMSEWGTRLVVREKNNISGKEDFLNIITIIEKTILLKNQDQQMIQKNGFSINIDINTVAENSSERFTSENIADFIKIATNFYDSIVSEIVGDKKNEKIL